MHCNLWRLRSFFFAYWIRFVFMISGVISYMFRPHIDEIVSKAALCAKLILKCFQSRNVNLLTKAFCTFVRPILEYCSVIWSPMFKCDINKIESVQRRFTKHLNGLYNLSNSCRLARLGLDSSYCRRVKADLILCYKILNNLVSIDSDMFSSVLLHVTQRVIVWSLVNVTLFLRETAIFLLTVLLMYGILCLSMWLLHQLFLALNVDLSCIISAHDIVWIIVVNSLGHMLMQDILPLCPVTNVSSCFSGVSWFLIFVLQIKSDLIWYD